MARLYHKHSLCEINSPRAFTFKPYQGLTFTSNAANLPHLYLGALKLAFKVKREVWCNANAAPATVINQRFYNTPLSHDGKA